jgi:hypothetical protein
MPFREGGYTLGAARWQGSVRTGQGRVWACAMATKPKTSNRGTLFGLKHVESGLHPAIWRRPRVHSALPQAVAPSQSRFGRFRPSASLSLHP